MLSNGSDTDFGAVVVAAGSSTRFGGAVPKQFHELAGQTVLARSVAAIARHPAIGVVVVVLAPGELDTPRAQALQRLHGALWLVAGGARRSDSVRLGLEACGEVPFVLVHDAARPLAGAALVDSVIEATRRHGAAVPGLAVPDTIKQVDADGWIERTLDRSRLQLIQTPQGSRRAWLLEALLAADRDGCEVTDEASALERAGRRVALVPGERRNRKLTTAGDLEDARTMLEGEQDLAPVREQLDSSADARDDFLDEHALPDPQLLSDQATQLREVAGLAHILLVGSVDDRAAGLDDGG